MASNAAAHRCPTHFAVRRLIASVVLLQALVCAACAGNTRHPELWLIPNGYTGWIYTRWQLGACPATPLRDGWLVIEVPPDGRYCTSSTLEEGVAHDRFLYVDEVGEEIDELPYALVHTQIYQDHRMFHFIGANNDPGRWYPKPPVGYGP